MIHRPDAVYTKSQIRSLYGKRYAKFCLADLVHLNQRAWSGYQRQCNLLYLPLLSISTERACHSEDKFFI